MEPEVADQSCVELTLVDLFEEETVLKAALRCSPNNELRQNKTPTVLLVVECGSGLDDDSNKTMKRLLLKFVGDLQENQAQRIFLAWNDKSYELTARPQSEIRQILEAQHPPTDKHQLSYQATLQTLRHSIVALKGKLTEGSNLSLVFFSSQIEPEVLLMEGSNESQFEKYLFSRNSHKEDIDEELNKLRKVINGSVANITVDAVAFGKYADYILLQKLVSLGNGSFSYGSSFTDLEEIFERLVPKLTYSQLYCATIGLKVFKRTFHFMLCSTQDNLYYSSQMNYFLQPDETAFMQTGQVGSFRYGREDLIIPSKVFKRQPVDRMEYLQLKLLLFNDIAAGILCNHEVVEVQRIPDPERKVRFIYIKVLNKEKLQLVERQRDRLRVESDKIYEQAIKMKMGERRKLIDDALELKRLLLVVEEHLVTLYKVEFTQDHFCRVMGEVSIRQLKNSFRKKILRRMNANPRMIEEAYERIHDIVGKYDPVELDNKYAYFKKEIGNCPFTFMNFVSAFCNEDCLAIAIEIERPDTAIADPSRIVIRNIAFQLVAASEFLIRYANGTFKVPFDILVSSRKHGDYGFDKPTVWGLVPIYASPEHWESAKLLMKPCLGWTVCGEPLAYSFSQIQTVPFLLLSKAIEFLQLAKYDLQQNAVDVEQSHTLQNYYDELHQKNNLKSRHDRLGLMVNMLKETCKAIITDTSTEKFEQPLDKQILSRYAQYERPINRTVDVIPNNYVFLTQLVCLMQMGRMEKPSEANFHEFFKRMVEEQLRRQTDGWKEEDVQDQFVNKILNVEMEKLEKPTIVVLESDYRERFNAARDGQSTQMIRIEERKQELQLRLKKDEHFNDVQRMLLIQYKRLYEHKAIQLWFLRFELYPEIERKLIHKWKALDLANSYMLFCLIIQNKTQRKNATRREAVANGEYVDPFDYYAARQFIEDTFLTLKQKQQQKNLRFVQATHFNSALSAFALTQDPVEAAGALLSCDLGHNITQYYTALYHERRPEIIVEKMHMLLTGSYKGVRLFNGGWKMSKQKMNTLSSVYHRSFPGYNWML